MLETGMTQMPPVTLGAHHLARRQINKGMPGAQGPVGKPRVWSRECQPPGPLLEGSMFS